MMRDVRSAAPAIELLDEPAIGRRFSIPGRVRLGDVDRGGRMRLDSIARVLQDVASDDASDAGLDRRFGWLVRRTLIDTEHPAVLGETFEATTWCTGIGRSWAERRTRIRGARGATVDAVSLWVQVDVATKRPTRISSDFVDAYATASQGRTVSARLALPGEPSRRATHATWHVRRTDLDPFGHVNNASTWSFLEEAVALDRSPRIGRAEMEYLQPIERDEDGLVLLCERTAETSTAWLERDGTTLAAARWSVAPT